MGEVVLPVQSEFRSIEVVSAELDIFIGEQAWSDQLNRRTLFERLLEEDSGLPFWLCIEFSSCRQPGHISFNGWDQVASFLDYLEISEALPARRQEKQEDRTLLWTNNQSQLKQDL